MRVSDGWGQAKFGLSHWLLTQHIVLRRTCVMPPVAHKISSESIKTFVLQCGVLRFTGRKTVGLAESNGSLPLGL